MSSMQIDCLGNQFFMTHAYISRKEGDIITYHHEEKCKCPFMNEAKELALQLMRRA